MKKSPAKQTPRPTEKTTEQVEVVRGRDSSGGPTPSASDTTPGSPAVQSRFSVFVTVFWIMAGPMILFLLLVNIVRTGAGWCTPLDIVFFAVLALMVFCRWFDQQSGVGTT